MRSLMKGGASRFVDVVSLPQKIGFSQLKWIERIGSSEYFDVLPRKQKVFFSMAYNLNPSSYSPYIPYFA